MGRPRKSDVDTATPERLLAAAIEEFGRVGFSAARLEDIARRAAIRRPSLLYHYPSKESLYAAAVRRTFAHLGEALFGALDGEGGFPERLEQAAERFAAFLAASPAVAHLVIRELIDERGPGAEILLTEVVPLLDRLEVVVRRGGKGVLRRALPVRAAILQVASSILLRSAMGPVAAKLWGTRESSGALVRALFFKES
jgi:AcrR family transcriptional regulator